MGEYARRKSDGAEIKIGTCEDMYYLRADQRDQVEALEGSVDVSGPDAFGLRFRFPWPDEDAIEPGGDFHANGYARSVPVPGHSAPAARAHNRVQFTAQAGYLASLPCPEGPEAQPVPIQRNGFAGAVQLVAQKLLRDGRLVPVLRCGGCRAMWREEGPAQIEALAVAFRAEADRLERLGQHNGTGATNRVFHDAIADRIMEGARLALV